MAVDLGCGPGDDVLALLERGWTVSAVDKEQGALDLLRASIPAEASGRVSITCAEFSDAVLPPAHLVYAGFALPFCPPSRFASVWESIKATLLPGGVLAAHIFGPNDDWAGLREMTFHNPDQIRELLGDTEILYLREKEWHGGSASGPKHWHVTAFVAKLL